MGQQGLLLPVVTMVAWLGCYAIERRAVAAVAAAGTNVEMAAHPVEPSLCFIYKTHKPVLQSLRIFCFAFAAECAVYYTSVCDAA